jgi:hypothetical protein
MYQLTVDAADTVTVTDHLDRDDAHGQLMRRAVTGDYYLRTVQTTPAHATYELLHLAEGRRQPRSAGHAIIERVDAADGLLPVDPPERAADAARLWIAHHQLKWAHGADTDPDDGYPTAILSAARAEARCWFHAGLLLPEAARLAHVDPIPRPGQQRLEALRRNAISAPAHRDERLAAIVAAQLGGPSSAPTLVALIWWYALLSWGATAP